MAPDVAAGRVLVVDDDLDTRELLREILEDADFQVMEANDGQQALEIAVHQRPDVVLMDVNMPRVDGLTATRLLRADPRTRSIPVIVLTAQTSAGDWKAGLEAGAVDYLRKPPQLEEVRARVDVILHRSRELAALSPLTGLPGNPAIEKELGERISKREPFSLLYLDLDHFKAINDHYDWLHGDRIIRAFADLLLEVVGALTTDAFIGHVGGDDFVVICPPDEAAMLAEEVCRRFDAMAPTFYDEVDRQRGGIHVPDRRGLMTRYPFVSVSIGIIDGHRRTFQHPGEAATVASEVKRYVKALARPGSAWAIDRRHDDID